MAHDPDGRPGASAQTRLPGSGSDHDEWQVCSIAGINDVIDPLVGVEARHGEEEPLVASRVAVETPGIDGRINNDGTPAVCLLDAAGDCIRAGDEQVHLLGRSIVQAAKRGPGQRGERPLVDRHGPAGGIAVEAPEKARWRVAVRHVDGTRRNRQILGGKVR